MATYGRGQMLGAGINPESFKQDYSGFANAAAIQAQGIANLGKDIGNTIQNVSEIKKENKKIDAMNKAAAKSIEAAITLGNSYGIAGANETLSPFLAAANDPNLSAIEKAALLSEAKNMIPSVFGRFDKSQEIKLQQAQLAGRGSGSVRPSNLKLTSIKEMVNGQMREVAVTFDPSTGITRRFDGTIVNTVPVAASIDEAANLPSPTSLNSAAATNMQPVAELPQGGMDEEAPSVLPPLYTDDTSKLPPLEKIQPVPVGAKPEDINAALSISQQNFPPASIPIDAKQEEKWNQNVKQGNLLGQQNSKTGEFKPYPGQTNGRVTRLNPETGQLEVLEGNAASSVLSKAPVQKLKEGETLVEDPNSPTGTRIVQIPSEMLEKSKADFTTYVQQIGESYASLNQMGKAVAGGEVNPLNFAESTSTGQAISRMFGSDAQVLRDQINTMVPNIINVVRQSTQMGAKGLDSEKELTFYLRSVGDPTLPVEANIKALDILDKAYGKGDAVKQILKNYPDLAKRVDKYNFSPAKSEQATTGSVGLSPEAQAILDRAKNVNNQK